MILHTFAIAEYITPKLSQVLGFFDRFFPQVRLRQLTSRIKVLHIAGSVARPADLAPKAATIFLNRSRCMQMKDLTNHSDNRVLITLYTEIALHFSGVFGGILTAWTAGSFVPWWCHQPLSSPIAKAGWNSYSELHLSCYSFSPSQIHFSFTKSSHYLGYFSLCVCFGMCWDFCSPSSPGPLVGFWADSSIITSSPPDLLEGTEDLPAPDSEELGGLQWSRLSLPDREDQDGNDGI